MVYIAVDDDFATAPGTGFCRRGRWRWADVDASEDEEETTFPSLPAALALKEDSYREAPAVQGFEDSKDEVIRRLEGDVNLGTAPKDFAFLLADDDDKENKVVPAKPSSPPAKPSSPLNASAPEFIPTLSMACPLVGSLELQENQIPRIANEQHEDCAPAGLILADTDANDDVSEASTPQQFSRRPSGEKLRPPVLQVTCMAKRTRGSELTCVRTPRNEGAPSKHAKDRRNDDELPEVSEEEWQRRIEVRRRSIEVGKATREYRTFTESKGLHDEREVGDEPLTPDPTDRKSSKRRFKFEVQQWRIQLRQWYIEEGYSSSAISTDEWQSVMGDI